MLPLTWVAISRFRPQIPLVTAEVAEVPHHVLRADDAVPPAHQLGVVFLNGGERAEGLRLAERDDPAMAEMRVANEKNFAHGASLLFACFALIRRALDRLVAEQNRSRFEP